MKSLLISGLVIVFILQFILVLSFEIITKKRLKKYQSSINEGANKLPFAEVILCLRGANQEINIMLDALRKQVYPSKWRLQVIVDSNQDPSYKLVNNFLEKKSLEIQSSHLSNVEVNVLKKRPKTGSLKCASLIQALNNIHQDSQIIALIDADAIVDKDWLSKLSKACMEPGIGAVSGNRWFPCDTSNFNCGIRAVWNGGALVLMTLLSIPWGGSLAVKREVIQDGEWLKLLEHGLCEDTGLLKPLKKLGLKYLYRPEILIIDNSKDLDLFQLANWITRQILTARLHHPAWPIIAFHGIGSIILIALSFLFGCYIPLLVYELGCILLLVWIESIAVGSSSYSWVRWLSWLIPGQLIYGWSTIMASLINKVEWSGVVYKINKNPTGVNII